MTDATAIVDDALRGLVTALATHDPEEVLAMFTAGGATFGSDDGEEAVGRDEMRALFTGLCARPDTISWTWEIRTAGHLGDVVWFVASGAGVLTAPDGTKTTVADPYRLSGVLRRTQGRWLFAVLNGSEPHVPS